MKGQVKICFGQLKILLRYLINLSREDSVRPVCQLIIKEKLINLIEWTFKREGSPYIACN